MVRKIAPPKNVAKRSNRKPPSAKDKDKDKPPRQDHRAAAPAAASPSQQAAPPGGGPPQLPFATQLRVLDVFAQAFADELSGPGLESTVQQIKGDLFKRDFAAAFGGEERLAIYAARWSPTRALCYASIFDRLGHHLRDLAAGAADRATGAAEGQADSGVEEEEHGEVPPLRMVSIGGGAAELASAAAYLACNPHTPACDLTLVDSGPWASVVDRLRDALTTPPPAPSYLPSGTVTSAPGEPFVPAGSLSTTFRHCDVLDLDKASLAQLLGPPAPLVVTLLFTLNELYTSGGVGRTTTLLLNLGACLAPGSLLLVVDSPGSYAETGVGAQSKQYPMRWLLEHTLLKTAAPGLWERLESSDSAWFRLAESLRYPIALENMRYQLHLYRVLAPI